VLAHGLERLGILKDPAAEALREDRQTYKRYTLHNTSHMLGIDVHDASAVPYREGKLEPGMALTIEPGLYFQPDDLTVPPRLRGIGIRIEEDVVVTKTGCNVLSRDIPRKSKDVEAWIAQIWKAKK
jgi:Xaa-Pro aminopeptidase